jgi:hypothetical protein
MHHNHSGAVEADDAFEPSGVNVQTVVFCIRKLGGQ